LQQSSHLNPVIWAKFVLKRQNAQASLMGIYLSVIWCRIGISDHYFAKLLGNDAKLHWIQSNPVFWAGDQTAWIHSFYVLSPAMWS